MHLFLQVKALYSPDHIKFREEITHFTNTNTKKQAIVLSGNLVQL